MDLDLVASVARETPSKIILLVIDGLGGLPNSETGKSELETAYIPNLDQLAAESACGLIDPVVPGITPGSGPGHLALFGYDPVQNLVGRGVLEALGIDLELKPNDVASRGNFCTLDKNGLITDRRAGRISTHESAPLCQLLDRIEVPGMRLSVHPVRDHRFVVIFQGSGINDGLTESDPQKLGVPPLEVEPLSPQAESTAKGVNAFIAQAKDALRCRDVANMILLRGFSRSLTLPTMKDRYRLKAAAIAAYPMYRGLAKLVGMEVLPMGNSFEEEVETLARHYGKYDFFYIHFKGADAAGEDGDFAGKVQALEEVDRFIPKLRTLNLDVFMITGDHSTPAVLAGHSWHPVPFLLCSQWASPDDVKELSERACASGALGRFPATHVLPLAMAHALKLTKFGA